MKTKLYEMYLDWYNNFLTIDCFADYYNISNQKAERILAIGRKINQLEIIKKEYYFKGFNDCFKALKESGKIKI